MDELAMLAARVGRLEELFNAHVRCIYIYS